MPVGMQDKKLSRIGSVAYSFESRIKD